MLILLHGKKRAGKDYFFNIANAQQEFKKLAFADPLKTHVATIYNVNLEELEKAKNNPSNIPNFRRILQETGDLLRRVQGENYFCEKLENKIRNTNSDIIVTDVRYLNELNYLNSKFDCINVKIVRPGKESNDSHESEKGIDDSYFDYIMTNNDDGEYFSDVTNLIKELTNVTRVS